MAFYVLARRGFLLGYHGAPVIAAQQAIELLIKVVVQQHDRKDTEQHRVVSSLRKHQNHISSFRELLNDEMKVRFLNQLSEAYNKLRYGEAGSETHADRAVQRLDEIVRVLWDDYLGTLRWLAHVSMWRRTTLRWFSEIAPISRNPISASVC